MGFNDLHPAIVAAAAAKTGTRLLLPFPLAPPQAKKYLIKAAGCGALLFPAPLTAPMEQLLADDPQTKRIVVPTFNDWFTATPAPRFQGKSTVTSDTPWLIFHTSGTTGMPKLVTYTQRMLASLAMVDSAAIPKNRISSMSLFKNSRMHTSIPFVHLVGLVSILPAPILHGTHLVLGPLDRPPSGETIVSLLKYGQIEGLATVPLWIRHLCNNPDGLAMLRKLKYVSWAGTSLDKISGDTLCQYTQLSPSFGTTECGPYWTLVTEDPKDWAYYSFIDGQGIDFVEAGDGLYEFVIRKSPDAKWQQIFMLQPELDLYRTSDLFKKHPTKPGLWLYSGRKDDMFKLDNGFQIHYTSREQAIEEDPSVKTALIGAPGQTIPFLLIEAADPSKVNLQSIWQTIAKGNQEYDKRATIHEDMIILADPKRPFKRSVKDTILRKETFEMYKTEIEQSLTKHGYSWNILN